MANRVTIDAAMGPGDSTVRAVDEADVDAGADADRDADRNDEKKLSWVMPQLLLFLKVLYAEVGTCSNIPHCNDWGLINGRTVLQYGF